MTEIEPRISGVSSDRTTNCTTTTAQAKEFYRIRSHSPTAEIVWSDLNDFFVVGLFNSHKLLPASSFAFKKAAGSRQPNNSSMSVATGYTMAV